jgi:hypothetical protein
VISVIFDAIKFALDAFKTIRDVAKDKSIADSKLIQPKILFDARRTLIQLQAQVGHLGDAIQSSNQAEFESAWASFVQHLESLVNSIEGLNFAVLDVYCPSLGTNLALAYGVDNIVFGALQRAKGGYGRIDEGERSEQHEKIYSLVRDLEEQGLWQSTQNDLRLKELLFPAGAVVDAVPENAWKLLDMNRRSITVFQTLRKSEKVPRSGLDSRDTLLSQLTALSDVLRTCTLEIETVLKENWKLSDFT